VIIWPSFQTRVPGKWVLAGEHAVLRGATAIALPHPVFKLSFSFEPRRGAGLVIEPEPAVSVMTEILQSISDEWHERGLSFQKPEGILRIESTIPFGAGLGSSAALSVAVTRWLSESLSIAENDHFEFAKNLEHRFHGRSSGMDVAAVLANEPISFVINRGYRALGVKKLPRFTFHDTNERARTSDCIIRVKVLQEESPSLAMKIDEQMSHAARLAMEGLVLFDGAQTKTALQKLAEAMKIAQECFYSWGLVPSAAKRLEEELLEKGALATKITGAGGGGMIVALWAD
jgi:mevalonate kinase